MPARRVCCYLALGMLLLMGSRTTAQTQTPTGTFQPLGEVFLVNGNASGLARYQDYLYLVMNESTHPLVVYDLHEPGRPKLLGHWPALGWPMRCRLVGPRWLWTVHGNGEGFFRLDKPAFCLARRCCRYARLSCLPGSSVVTPLVACRDCPTMSSGYS